MKKKLCCLWVVHKYMVIHLLTTRFDNNTWQENCYYREKYAMSGCIYGSATKIKEKIPLNDLVFIIEMNNSSNHIMGIGLCRNMIHLDKYYKIYDSGTYNRYTYKSDYRLDRLYSSLDPALITALEKICFKGKTHLKRGIGFTSIPEDLKRGLDYDLEKAIRDAFLQTFGKNVIGNELDLELELDAKSYKKPKLMIVENFQ